MVSVRGTVQDSCFFIAGLYVRLRCMKGYTNSPPFPCLSDGRVVATLGRKRGDLKLRLYAPGTVRTYRGFFQVSVGAGYPRCSGSRPARSRRTGLVPSWAVLGQLEEELDTVARTGDQVDEVLHFMGGEDSPRRVLCPWRANRLASTLPAVARATAVCFLKCECLRGRGVGRPRDPSRRWGARCSSGCDNLENRASVRLCGPCWEPLETDGQPCDVILSTNLLSYLLG